MGGEGCYVVSSVAKVAATLYFSVSSVKARGEEDVECFPKYAWT